MQVRDLVAILQSRVDMGQGEMEVKLAHSAGFRRCHQYSIGDVVEARAHVEGSGGTVTALFIGEGEWEDYLPANAAQQLRWTKEDDS